MKKVKNVDEDAVVGAGEGAAPSGFTAQASDANSAVDTDVVTDKGTSTEDVLGKFDPDKGFMRKDDFHIPKNVLGKGKVLKRYDLPYGGKKKKNLKNDYIKGMKVINEVEFSRQMLINIHRIREEDLKKYILKFFGDEISVAMYVKTIAYFPFTETLFVKIIDPADKLNMTKYVNLDFINGKFNITKDMAVYSTEDIIEKYNKLNGMKCWIVWGDI